MPVRDRFATRLFRLQLLLPRRTIRVRLTALYGALFLLSGAGLLAMTYALVLHATARDGVLFTTGPRGAIIVGPSEAGPSPDTLVVHQRILRASDDVTARAIQSDARAHRARAVSQHASDLRQFVIQAGIALAVMTVTSIALGWIVAGRVLHPLRTITRTARAISASNLHARLALTGPDDELKELGETFDGLVERLERSFRSQRQFVANASHELRTPLARQRAMVQVALSDPDATIESLRAAHERVLIANHQQERLIEALLTLARSEAGLDRREPLDLAEVTEQVLLSRDAEAARRGLCMRSTRGYAPIAGDRRLVERLIANLVDNALRHNVASGWIEVSTGTSVEHAMLSVANTGPIVPVPDVARLFQPFQRLAATRSRDDDGLGLGLSIVQAVASAHDATVVAHPRAGGGLEVTVTFPSRDARPGSA